MNIISNNYGLGHDDLYIPNRGRIHTDNSIEIKYYDNPERALDKMAFTFTGDLGCEFGDGVELPQRQPRQSQAELYRLHALQPILVPPRLFSA